MTQAWGKGVAGFAAVLAVVGLVAAAEPPPLKVIQTTEANFPPVLLAEGIVSGHVKAVVHVDAEGRLVDHLIIGYTHRALATELSAVLPGWKFEGPRNHGEPISLRTIIEFHFTATGTVLSLTSGNAQAAISRWIPDPLILVLCEAGALDRPLQALHTAPPFHPGRRLRPSQPQGTATIDFYVDADGRPRMPVVATASHEAFGAAATDAVAQWRFTPPTRDGNPVLVRVRQQFVFKDNS
jgi:TonB family protein